MSVGRSGLGLYVQTVIYFYVVRYGSSVIEVESIGRR